jgi:hypothetical protein
LLVTLGGCPPKIAALLGISFGITKTERGEIIQNHSYSRMKRRQHLKIINATVSSN